jgi:hypothetical protein
MASSIGDLIVANITQREFMMIIVAEDEGSDADFVQARQRGENVDALVIEVGHGRTVGATGQAGESVENASKCGRRGPDDG